MKDNVFMRTKPTPVKPRLKFPLFSSARPGSLSLTNADLAREVGDEDARRLGLPRPNESPDRSPAR
jgi:hypothetical protein